MGKKIVHVEFPSGDAGRATSFWSSFAGWAFEDSGMAGIDYRMFSGEPGGAVYAAEDGGGSGLVVYFDSTDIDADVAKVRELGGTAEDKQPIPTVGWFARCRDTEGNAFSLFQSDESVAPH